MPVPMYSSFFTGLALEFLVWTVTRYPYISESLAAVSRLLRRLYVVAFPFGQSSHALTYLPREGMAQTFFLQRGMAETLRANKERQCCCTARLNLLIIRVCCKVLKLAQCLLVRPRASRFGIYQYVALIKFEDGIRKKYLKIIILYGRCWVHFSTSNLYDTAIFNPKL